jgi:DNA-binding XRE family transcriptional regulator
MKTNKKIQPKRPDHKEFLKEAIKRPGVIKVLEELEPEFKIYEELIQARLRLGKTQEEVAKYMHTSVSAIGRLETVNKINPTLSTLRRYAEALGLQLQLKLIKPSKKKIYSC